MTNDNTQADGYYNENTKTSKEDFDLSFLDDESEK
jgi:hypothetical protein